nr:hypothetical protein [Streptomyces sp. NBC_00268]
MPTTDLDAVPFQDGDPVGGEHGAVDDCDLLVETVREREFLPDPQVAADQTVPGVGGSTEQLGLVDRGEGLTSLPGKQPGGGTGPRAAAMDASVPEEKNIRLVCRLQLIAHRLKRFTPDDVIAVQEQQVVTGGALRPRVAYPADADDARQPNDRDPPIAPSIVIHQVRRAFSRLVQDRDNLHVPEGLVQYRIQADLQLSLKVVRGDYDTDHRGTEHSDRT